MGFTGVCLKPKQFSCWNEDDPNRAKLLAVGAGGAEFAKALEIATAAVDGRLNDTTHQALHFHTAAVSPEWSAGLQPATTIGSHRFFNNVA